MPDSSPALAPRVARELDLSPQNVAAALALFEEGATLPFIARYRKERTGGLDEIQLRDVRDRAAYLKDLEDRRAFILESVQDQGALTPELEKKVRAAGTKQELEDLYLPYRPKRRTRATMARERGLEPLADALWDGTLDDAGARREAQRLVDPEKDIPDAEAALQGARDILAERLAEDAEIRGHVREVSRRKGNLFARVLRGKKELPEAQRFRDYFQHTEPLKRVQSHRVLAIRRGEAEGILAWGVESPPELEGWVEGRAVGGRRAREELRAAGAEAWKRLLHPALESDIKGELREAADEEAIRIFGTNLENLLLQAPAGERRVLGLDPGFRTGVKMAMVSRTGALLDTDVLPLHQEDRFREGILRLVKKHRPELIAVGNGTASRETEQAVGEALEALVPAPGGGSAPHGPGSPPQDPGSGPRAAPSAPQAAGGKGQDPEDASGPSPLPAVVSVNEAGASVYSASELAARELPGLDVSLRGAVSIARRLQDPLAELVKIDARSIGVGQYQHDVNQTRLAQRLDEVVERCVNRVGVEVNTASPALLSHVAGIGPRLAENVVRLRDERGGLKSRKELLDVPLLGPKAFEQAGGFLRIRGGAHPLDATAVHPERYKLVEAMARDLGTDVGGLVENQEALASLEGKLESYAGEEVGLPTLRDILEELRRPGRDPRETFEAPRFREDVRKPEDLKVDMVLQGVVTNVVAFGAFVDVGVHQDGLVHISQLADRFVKDPAEVVAVGQKVRVKVVSLELDRGRIGLSMKAVG